MADPLLPYYNRELVYIRKLAAEFAEAHPKIAGRLRLSADAVEDPHVGRLIEAVAFLNARTRAKLDDDFPELTEALLSVLYPHYLAPIPSMAIVQFTCQPDLSTSYRLPAGTELDSEPVSGEVCRFRTCYPTELWPIELEAATLTGRPLLAPPNRGAVEAGAIASLRLTLRCRNPDMTFAQLGVDRLRFFLKAQPQLAYPLYELLLNNTVSIALADNAVDTNAVILPPSRIRPIGFGTDEGVLPYPPQSFLGYRLLTEFFAFPEKFLFFELSGLSAKTLAGAGNKLEVFLYLSRTSNEMERSLSADAFALGCTPVINLFRQRAEPIQLNALTTEYRLVPDARRPAALEVFSVDAASATSPGGESVTYRPFYSVQHVAGDRTGTTYWHTARRRASAVDPATDVFLSLVNLDFDPNVPADWVMSVQTTCLNRDLPGRLPFGGGHPYLQFAEAMSGVASIACLTAPTPTIRAIDQRGGRWRLLSHLTLNHLSLTGGDQGTDALREILKLYDFRDSSETRAIIDSINAIRTQRGTARAPQSDMGAFCRGIDVAVEFDEQRLSGTGVFLFASVLERFLSLYCSINSFVRLTATVKGRPGVLRKWPPRAGDRVLL